MPWWLSFLFVRPGVHLEWARCISLDGSCSSQCRHILCHGSFSSSILSKEILQYGWVLLDSLGGSLFLLTVSNIQQMSQLIAWNQPSYGKNFPALCKQSQKIYYFEIDSESDKDAAAVPSRNAILRTTASAFCLSDSWPEPIPEINTLICDLDTDLDHCPCLPWGCEGERLLMAPMAAILLIAIVSFAHLSGRGLIIKDDPLLRLLLGKQLL